MNGKELCEEVVYRQYSDGLGLISQFKNNSSLLDSHI